MYSLYWELSEILAMCNEGLQIKYTNVNTGLTADLFVSLLGLECLLLVAHRLVLLVFIASCLIEWAAVGLTCFYHYVLSFLAVLVSI